MEYREFAITKIEEFANKLINDGLVSKWFEGTDELTRRVSGKFNGPLAEELAKQTGYIDEDCIQMFREGAPVTGALPESGLLEKAQPQKKEAMPLETLLAKAEAKNKELLSKLKPEKHGQHLLKEIMADVEKGRMSEPQKAESLDLKAVVLSKRFGLEQGTKSDGSVKIKAVDDCTGSDLNETITKTEKMVCDGVDKAILVAQWFDMNGQTDLSMGKVDIASAYRRVPIKAEHRKLSWIAFKIDEQTMASRHNALCFGSTGIVYGWNRVGMFLTHVILHILKLPTGRWVDDIFWVEPTALVRSPFSFCVQFSNLVIFNSGQAKHTLECVDRLVKAILGPDAGTITHLVLSCC